MRWARSVVVLGLAILSGCAAAIPTMLGSVTGWAFGKGAETYLLKDPPARVLAQDPDRILEATSHVLGTLGAAEFTLTRIGAGLTIVQAKADGEVRIRVEIAEVTPPLWRVTVSAGTGASGFDTSEAVLALIEDHLRLTRAPQGRP